jgi:phosphoribosylformylglycinamidine synthase
MKGRVLVRLRPEVLDPQGETIAQALGNLGYDAVRSIRQGKVFEVELDTGDADEAAAMLAAMAKELLANPVIEDFQVRVIDQTDADGAAADRRARKRRAAERRGSDNRRSGRDRRADLAAARAAAGLPADEDRRDGDERRESRERRDDDRRNRRERRADSERRARIERRQTEDRRGGSDDDFEGPERRGGSRRRGARRGEDE